MSTSTELSPNRTSSRVVTSGRWCAAAGLVGLLQGLILLAWPPQVSDDRFSFPLSSTGHVVAQATFFLQHLPLVVALVVLAGVVSTKAARYGLMAAATGLALLAVMEIVAMSAATTSIDSSLASAVYAAYGPPVLLAGIGLTVAGFVLVRRREPDARIAWLVLALGIWVFIGLTPALSTNSFVAGRLAIMVWMILFAALGWAMSSKPARELSGAK